ncbi:PH domain-containing protein [Streptomyces chartreusis]|uniref:PH domain-containing protein n=1 Tax=Streptomyces TaxID=1883 RepID=UPI002E815B96|nr:PH domain-containing protein [Streptomyces chartreusis]WSZ66577.1 PH domain-containing protein [Streptomyces chartreusis]WUB21079.1 PH domain-containing protein [Streptomyces chartreusis]
MPLPFLTADRAFEAADDVALPFDDHERWRRPYRPGPWRVGAAALWLLLASYVLFAAVIIALTGTLPGAAVVFGIALAIIVGALRLLRMGVWVSSRGLRQVKFLVTRTVPWEQIAAVRTVQQPVRWLGLPRTVQGQALLLERRGRSADDVPMLMTTHNADFLARVAAFERATDSIEAWAAENSRG